MKILYSGVFLLLFQWQLYAQPDSLTTSLLPGTVVLQAETSINQTNKYGDLLNDDPVFNPKYKWGNPPVKIMAGNAFNLGGANMSPNLTGWHQGFDWELISKRPEGDEKGLKIFWPPIRHYF